MPKKKRRLSGISIEQVDRVCANHYKGDRTKIEVCQTTGRSIIRRIVAGKPSLCKKWCGCLPATHK